MYRTSGPRERVALIAGDADADQVIAEWQWPGPDPDPGAGGGGGSDSKNKVVYLQSASNLLAPFQNSIFRGMIF